MKNINVKMTILQRLFYKDAYVFLLSKSDLRCVV